MKKAHELPQAVNNLRAIWDKKKVEMKFTQVEAAAKLGWSQGAISHYLNNITDLGPAAVIKFANFLEVDPIDIDPTIKEHLPHVEKHILRYGSASLTKKIDRPVYLKDSPNAFWVEIDPTKLSQYETLKISLPFLVAQDSGVLMAQLCPMKEAPHAKLLFVQEKGKSFGTYRAANDLPPKNKILKCFATLEFRMIFHQE